MELLTVLFIMQDGPSAVDKMDNCKARGTVGAWGQQSNGTLLAVEGG